MRPEKRGKKRKSMSVKDLLMAGRQPREQMAIAVN
jgi:hypothetical protein